MATLVGTANFCGEILVVCGENPWSGAGFNLPYIIEKYEPEYLSAALGLAFYRDVLSVVTIDPDNVPQEYADLVNGVDYTDYNGELIHWGGLIEPTANYIYYWYKRNDNTSTSMLGEVVPSVENGVMALANQKSISAYNRSVSEAYNLQRYLKSQPDDTFPFYNKNRPLDCKMFHPINNFGI